MNILLMTLGSAGDVYPLVGLGLALKERGYQVSVITSPYFESTVQRAGLEFVGLGSLSFFETMSAHPDLWHPRKGPVLLLEQGLAVVTRPLYEIVSSYDPKDTLVVGAFSAIGARLAQEKLGTPLITIHYQPFYLRSLYDTPKMSTLPGVEKYPRHLKKWIFQQVDNYCARRVGPHLEQFREELGLPPVTTSYSAWSLSPLLVLGLFPKWFAAPQPDWPAQTRQTGFLMYDGHDGSSLPDVLEEFLKTGEPPIIFTFGSEMRQGQTFYKESAKACQILGCRAIFVTRHREQLPESLPANVLHMDYAPFSLLFPRAAALVSSGGIGTLALAMAAGIPNLIVPLSHDQPDNAGRIVRLGVGATITPTNFHAPLITRKLISLLSSTAIKIHCQEIAKQFDTPHALMTTCDLIEEIAHRAQR